MNLRRPRNDPACDMCAEESCFGCHAGDPDWTPTDCYGEPLEQEDNDGPYAELSV